MPTIKRDPNAPKRANPTSRELRDEATPFAPPEDDKGQGSKDSAVNPRPELKLPRNPPEDQPTGQKDPGTKDALAEVAAKLMPKRHESTEAAAATNSGKPKRPTLDDVSDTIEDDGAATGPKLTKP